MTHNIYRGWKAASDASLVQTLGSGKVVDLNMSVRVDGDVDEGAVLGNPLMVWAPISLISENEDAISPGENLRLWRDINCQKSSYMKTVQIFHDRNKKRSDVPDLQRMELAFIACALRMLWGYRAEIAADAEKSISDFCKLASLGNPNEIWGRGVWKTLPVAPPRHATLQLKNDGYSIGEFIRSWHDELFSKFRLADAWPISAKPTVDAPYMSALDYGIEVHEVIKTVKSVPASSRGTEEWRMIDREQMERMVWMYPRQQLARSFGVSDMAVIKRCRRERISAPPRGFWQKLRSATSSEMYMFLIENDTIPPEWWSMSISQNRVNNPELGEWVTAVSIQRERLEA